MFLRQLELTTALRPRLSDDETLLFVQDNVGLYEGKFKLERYQNGAAYLTSHRVCYVDNDEPRKYSVGIDLKDIDRPEFYAGFLKSSPKITLFPKPTKQGSYGIKSPVPRHATFVNASNGRKASPARSAGPSPALARDLNATWVCPICGFPNSVPASFDPSTANQHTPLPPCQSCGIKPPLVHIVKAAIAAMSNRPAVPSPTNGQPSRHPTPTDTVSSNSAIAALISGMTGSHRCSRCTFENHPSLSVCEMCGAKLGSDMNYGLPEVSNGTRRAESPGPTIGDSIIGDESIETIKFSFRAGGVNVFLERLKGALVQRKWLLQSAPPVPRPIQSNTPNNAGSWQLPDGSSRSSTPQQRVVGIAGLERRGAEMRENNQAVIGTAFEDLEALMTSAKEVIAMAEQFARQTDNGDSAEARKLISDSASALGLITTKDMLGGGSASESLYITELSRDLAEFLTDDSKGILRKEGGTMSLVDLWAVFNRTRNGIELVSPLDFEKAATMWEALHMPIRLRRFKSGLLVVQENSRTDEKTIASLLGWLREPQYVFPPPADDFVGRTFGRGITAQETAEKFGWSIGVATEELEMAEETGALCRDQCLDGIRFWENHFSRQFVEPSLAQSLHSMTLNI